MIRKATFFLAFNLALIMVLWLLLEGTASTVLVVQQLAKAKPIAERAHTTYDAELGWVNLPDIVIPDMYGPGCSLRINGQRFRHDGPVEPAVPAGKIRIICSGDSFTFGYGVDNDHTWCQQLATLDPRLETVNMGQGGYGVDQAYLWYKRDGVRYDHAIQLFAFVTTDFERMLFDSFLGYGKPMLDVHDGTLVVRNVPVPRPPWYRLWLVRYAPILQKLSAVQAVRALLPSHSAPDGRSREEIGNWARQVLAAIIEDLEQINQAKHSVLVLVLLPTRDDYTGSKADFWRDFLHTESARRHIAYIDVIAALRRLPPQEIEPLFIREGQVGYVAAAGHYSEKGNAYIATQLYESLRTLPETAAKYSISQLR